MLAVDDIIAPMPLCVYTRTEYLIHWLFDDDFFG